MSLAIRVASRYLLGKLEVGRSYFNRGQLKLHRYRDHLKLTDMTFAGKRGKKVRMLAVFPESPNDKLAEQVLDQAVSSIGDLPYDKAKAKLADIAEKYPNLLSMREDSVRGVDVEPMGTSIEFTSKLDNGAQIRVTASPHEFRVVHSQPLESGRLQGNMQDTMYYSVKKTDGITFYGWLKDNLAAAQRMDMAQLRKLWNTLGVRYDYQ